MIYELVQGHRFQDMTTTIQSEHIIALCSLVASTQRCYGLWRLREVNSGMGISFH